MNSDNENKREPSLGHAFGKRTLVYLGALVLLFALFLIINTGDASAAGPTYVYEDISTDTTWTEDGSPYILNASISVLPGATLTIEPNVTVMADPGNVLEIKGGLVAIGTSDEPILFTTNDTLYWWGIVIDDTGTAVFSNVIIELAYYGVYVEDANAAISDTLIQYSYRAGIWWSSSGDIDAELSGVEINHTYEEMGIMLLANNGNATVSLTDCIVNDTYGPGIVVQATGWIDATISGTTVIGSAENSGIILYSTGGDVGATLNSVTVNTCELNGVLIYSAVGGVDVQVSGSVISANEEAGLQVEGSAGAVLGIENSEFSENLVGVAVYAVDGDVIAQLSGVSILDNSDYGLIANSASGNVDLSLTSVVINNSDFTVGVFAKSNEADVNAVIQETSITGGVNGLDLESGGNVSVAITDSELIANRFASIIVIADGSATVAIEQSYMNGEEANEFAWYYPEEIDHEYDIINPDGYYTGGGSFYVSLPFAFPFGTGTYTDLYIYTNGFISVGGPYSGSFPINMNYVSANLIVPCQDYFYTSNWPYVSYKIVDGEKIIVQWYVSRSSDPWYVTNVFQAILYSNGDIQFNYANMDALNSNDYSNQYGVKAGSNVNIILNDLWIPNVYNADEKSIYLTRETFATYAAIVESNDGIEASIVNSTISHYAAAGALFLCGNGDVNIDAVNLTVDYIIGMGEYGVALGALTENGTMDAMVADSMFSHIGFIALGFLSSPQWGGEDIVEITGNTFDEVVWAIAVMTEVEDDDGFNEMVEFSATRTISGNIGTNSGGIMIGAWIGSIDSTWDVSITDAIVNNNFSGRPMFSSGFMSEAFILVGHSIYSEDTNMTVELNTEITGNSIESIGMAGIVVGEEVSAYAGRATVISSVVLSDNTLYAPMDIWFAGPCIGVYYDADSDTGIDSAIDVSVTDNEMLLDEYFSTYASGIDVGIYQSLSDGLGDGSLGANVMVDRNIIQNAGYGITLYVGAYTSNHFGNQTVDLTISVADNEIDAYYEIIDVYIEANTQYSNYYPPYETEVSSRQSMTFNVNITGNRAPYLGRALGIGVYTYTYAGNWMSIFSHPSAYMNGTVSITDNTIDVSYGEEADTAILVDNEVCAYNGESIAISTIATSITNNVINVSEDSDLWLGIYVYEFAEAYAEAYQFSMSPSATLNSDLVINENEINGPVYEGIYIESDVNSLNGMSFVNYQASQEISGNMISGYYDNGVYAYYDMEVIQFSYNAFKTSATANVTIALSVDDNIVSSEVAEEGAAVELYAYAWSNWEVESYISSNITAKINSNEISFGPDALWNYGIYVYCSPNGLVSVIADGNVIENADVGIDIEYCTVTLRNNVISSPGDEGIYLYESTGTVSGNEVTGGIYAQGIYLDECFQMNISDNRVDGCGDGIYVYYSDDLVISNNTLTNNGIEGYDTFGLYIYDSYNATITGNTITGNAVGVVIYYSYEITFSNNVVSNNLYEGAYFDECESLVIESNIMSENGGSGLELYDCYSVVIGNNTIRENLLYGLYIEYSGRVMIYNGIYQDNTYDGIYAYGVVEWIVDDVSEVRNNAITLYGDLTVVDGGMLTLDNVWYFMLGEDWMDGIPQIIVEDGGTLVVVASVLQGGYYYSFEVYGTLDMESSEVSGAAEIYLGPTSNADIRTSVVYENWRNGIHVDNCLPRISATTIIYNGMDGIFIEGADAAPTIMDCLIAMNNRGIYAIDSSLANVVDNVIVANFGVGIYVIGASGSIHDNILLFNPVEIYIKDSTVTVEDNQIGYSVIVDIMSKYAPALMGGGSVPLFGEWLLTPEMIAEAQMNHIGVYAVNSTVSLSDNVYGMLKYAIYVTQSTLTVSDTINMTTLVLPYYDDYGTLWNVSLPIIVYDGIYAAKSTVTVNGGMISVLDDAIFLESSNADLRNVVFDAGDFDIYLTGESIASAIEVTFEKAKVLDTSVLTVYYKLTVRALDQDGLPVSGVWVIVYDEEGSPVGEGATDDNGLFSVYAIGWIQTSAGQSAAKAYTVNASFEQGYVEKNVTLDKATDVIVEVPVEKPVAWNPSFAITFTLIAALLVAVALIIVSTKK
jgi:parallel beta-helix repeat protein